MLPRSEKQRGNLKKRPIPGEAETAAPPRTKADPARMQLRHPRSFSDVEEIIDRFRDHMTVIVYLTDLNATTALRVTDMLSGAIYALGGSMAQLQKDMYIFSPDGVESR